MYIKIKITKLALGFYFYTSDFHSLPLDLSTSLKSLDSSASMPDVCEEGSITCSTLCSSSILLPQLGVSKNPHTRPNPHPLPACPKYSGFGGFFMRVRVGFCPTRAGRVTSLGFKKPWGPVLPCLSPMKEKK